MLKNKEILSKIQAEIPDLAGFIEVKNINNTTIVAGKVITKDKDAKQKIEEIVSTFYPNTLAIYSIEVQSGLTVVSDENLIATESDEDTLDEVKVIYMGELPINAITPNSEFKFINNEYMTRIDDVVKVLDFIAPIILDSNLKVIDGGLRLEIAKNNFKTKVPVVVINSSGKKTDFLRMALNRSSEFQRWIYPDIDNYVDENPQVQPIAEPLGFFGKLLLPTSFFANTVVNYRLDEYNDQQKKYRQEIGIAEWAKLQRERNELELEAKKPRVNKSKEGMVSLFDLIPTKDDFVPTYDIKSKVKEHEEQMREVARTITENYDEERKPDLIKSGKWQGTRRTTSEKAADKRKEAEQELNVDDDLTSLILNDEEIKENVSQKEIKAKKDTKPQKKSNETKESKSKAKKSETKSKAKKMSLKDLISESESVHDDSLSAFIQKDEPKKDVTISDLF